MCDVGHGWDSGEGAGEMAQWINHVPHEHEDQSLEPQHPHENQTGTGVVATCSSSIWKPETKEKGLGGLGNIDIILLTFVVIAFKAS